VPTETEIKIRLSQDPASARRRIEQAGYRATGPRTLESDQLYDVQGGGLRLSGRLLRLRSCGDTWTLTYKGPAIPGRHKSREEIETGIDDGVALAGILCGLGFNPGFRYEKYRTTFAAPGELGIVTLDETPIGLFLELEGEADWIDQAAARLGFTVADYCTASYGSLFREFRLANPEVPEDMMF
jgi:adenylate cyclase class 2